VLQQFVAGRWLASAGGGMVEDLNPSDARDVVARVPSGSPQDVAAAAAAAAEALSGWQKLSGPARAEHLFRWSAAIAARQEELAQAMAREVGKPITEARGEVARCVAILRYYAGEAVREIGEVIPSQLPATLQFTLRQPLGVVALITPWNFPLAIPLWKAAPALAFGNTVIWKPAETASHMATLLAETSAQAELPAGVFNVVLGSGSVIGDPLVGHEAVRAVSFTGSSLVGARVAAAAASSAAGFCARVWTGSNRIIVRSEFATDRSGSRIRQALPSTRGRTSHDGDGHSDRGELRHGCRIDDRWHMQSRPRRSGGDPGHDGPDRAHSTGRWIIRIRHQDPPFALVR